MGQTETVPEKGRSSPGTFWEGGAVEEMQSNGFISKYKKT
jgi:hypothetical protein